jgi:hypothetical protein
MTTSKYRVGRRFVRIDSAADNDQPLGTGTLGGGVAVDAGGMVYFADGGNRGVGMREEAWCGEHSAGHLLEAVGFA